MLLVDPGNCEINNEIHFLSFVLHPFVRRRAQKRNENISIFEKHIYIIISLI